jgi:hypothetical protein
VLDTLREELAPIADRLRMLRSPHSLSR